MSSKVANYVFFELKINMNATHVFLKLKKVKKESIEETST